MRRKLATLAGLGLVSLLGFLPGFSRNANADLENTYTGVYSTDKEIAGDKRRILIETGRDDAKKEMYIRITSVAGYRIQGLETALVTNDFVKQNKIKIAMMERGELAGEKGTFTEVTGAPSTQQSFNFWNNAQQVISDTVQKAKDPLETAPWWAKAIASLVPLQYNDTSNANNNKRPQLEEALRENGMQMIHMQSYTLGTLRAAYQVQYFISCDVVQRKITVQDASGKEVERIYPPDGTKAQAWVLVDAKVFRKLAPEPIENVDYDTFRVLVPIQKGASVPLDRRVAKIQEKAKLSVKDYLPKDSEIRVSGRRIIYADATEKPDMLGGLASDFMYLSQRNGEVVQDSLEETLLKFSGKSRNETASLTAEIEKTKYNYSGEFSVMIRDISDYKLSFPRQKQIIWGNFPNTGGFMKFIDPESKYQITLHWSANGTAEEPAEIGYYDHFGKKLFAKRENGGAFYDENHMPVIFKNNEELEKFKKGLQDYVDRLGLIQVNSLL